MKIKNHSSLPQTRLTWVMLPKNAAEQIPDRGFIQHTGWAFVKADQFGDMRRILARADMGGGEGRTLYPQDFMPQPNARMGNPVPAEVLDGDANAYIEIGGRLEKFVFDRTVFHAEDCFVLRCVAKAEDFLAVVYLAFCGGVPIEYQGFVVASDRGPLWQHPQTISFVTQDPCIPTLGHLWDQHEATGPQGRYRHVIVDVGMTLDAQGHPFFGCVIPQPTPDPLQMLVEPGYEDKSEDLADRLALNGAIEAAREGPIVMLPSESNFASDGFGPQRLTAIATHGQPDAGYIDLETTRDRTDYRVWSNMVASGSSGEQGCWGMMKFSRSLAPGLWLTSDFLRLRYAGTDYWQRSHHHLDDQSDVMVPQIGHHFTYWTVIFYAAIQAWGKEHPIFGTERDNLSRQHRANLYMPIAALLTGDWILQDELEFLAMTDMADIRHWQRSWEASRSSGRLIQEWCWWMRAAHTEELRRVLEDLIVTEVGIVNDRVNRRTGPIRPASEFAGWDPKNPLFTSGSDCWSVWEESLLVAGLITAHDMWAVETPPHLADTVATLRSLIAELGGLVATRGTMALGGGDFALISWCKLPPNGEDLPASYYDPTRPGIRWGASGTPPFDMVVGGIGWSWYIPALEGALRNEDEATQDRARAICERFNWQGQNRIMEWMMGCPRVKAIVAP